MNSKLSTLKTGTLKTKPNGIWRKISFMRQRSVDSLNSSKPSESTVGSDWSVRHPYKNLSVDLSRLKKQVSDRFIPDNATRAYLS